MDFAQSTCTAYALLMNGYAIVFIHGKPNDLTLGALAIPQHCPIWARHITKWSIWSGTHQAGEGTSN